MLPTLRQLQYLKLLAEHGSFSRAALAAHVTQPTLSAGIQELEKILGAAMVDRNRSGVILTAAGAEAVARGGAILAQAEELAQVSRAAGQPLAGRFRLGVIPTVAPFLLPAALPALRARYPALRLFLREDLTHRLIADLKAGALDAAVIARPYDMAGLEWAHVGDDELLAAFPAGHPLAAAGPIAPERMDGEDLILLEDGHCLRDHALAACGRGIRRQSPEGGFAATSLATLVQMVGAGLGVSFLPAMAVEAGRADAVQVAVRPLAPTIPAAKSSSPGAPPPPALRKAGCWRRCSRRCEGAGSRQGFATLPPNDLAPVIHRGAYNFNPSPPPRSPHDTPGCR